MDQSRSALDVSRWFCQYSLQGLFDGGRSIQKHDLQLTVHFYFSRTVHSPGLFDGGQSIQNQIHHFFPTVLSPEKSNQIQRRLTIMFWTSKYSFDHLVLCCQFQIYFKDCVHQIHHRSVCCFWSLRQNLPLKSHFCVISSWFSTVLAQAYAPALYVLSSSIPSPQIKDALQRGTFDASCDRHSHSTAKVGLEHIPSRYTNKLQHS